MSKILRSIMVVGLFTACLCTAPLYATGIIGPGANDFGVSFGGLNIVDGGAGDTNSATGIIDFFNPVAEGAKYSIGGTLTKTVIPGESISLNLTNLTIEALVDNASGVIDFRSGDFPLIFAPALFDVDFDGTFNGSGYSASLAASANSENLALGTINVGTGSGNSFNESLTGDFLSSAALNILGRISFTLDSVGDTLFLPGSAHIAVYQPSTAVPETSTLFLLGTGFLLFAAATRKQEA